MTRDGDELTRETIKGTEESPMGLWDKSSSSRFVKEAEEGQKEKKICQLRNDKERKMREDKPILGGRSVSRLVERVREVTLEGSEMPRGKARLS